MPVYGGMELHTALYHTINKVEVPIHEADARGKNMAHQLMPLPHPARIAHKNCSYGTHMTRGVTWSGVAWPRLSRDQVPRDPG